MLTLLLILLSVPDAWSFGQYFFNGQQESAASWLHGVTTFYSQGNCGVDAMSFRDEDAVSRSRRIILMAISTLPLLTSNSVQASTGNMRTKIKPQTAYEGLIKARDELQQAQTKYLQNKDYNGLRDYLEKAENMNNFEPNALAILASNKLE
jgi:hypothetical protein